MHSFKSLIVSFFFVFTALAQPEGEVVIRTRDGKSRQGRVLSETQKGYLFASAKGTSVISFENIVDMKPVSTETEPAPAVAAPVVVAAAAPVAETPPPPPSAPSLPSIAEVSSAAPEKPARRGFHFGIGAIAAGGLLGATAGGQAIFDFNFGVPSYRLALNLGVAVGYGVGANVSIDNLFHLNFGDVYTLGIGARVGIILGFYGILYVGPVLQPVIIKLGDRGQHQLSLTLTGGPANSSGFFEASLGYAFLF